MAANVTLQRIPLRPRLAVQSIGVQLAGRPFKIDLDWNARIGLWLLSLFTGSGAPILRTKALVLNSDLLLRTRHNPDCPQGALRLRDLQDLHEEATLDSLGIRHALYFIPTLTPAEVAAQAASSIGNGVGEINPPP